MYASDIIVIVDRFGKNKISIESNRSYSLSSIRMGKYDTMIMYVKNITVTKNRSPEEAPGWKVWDK